MLAMVFRTSSEGCVPWSSSTVGLVVGTERDDGDLAGDLAEGWLDTGTPPLEGVRRVGDPQHCALRRPNNSTTFRTASSDASARAICRKQDPAQLVQALHLFQRR